MSQSSFSLLGRTALVTGGGGVLGSAMAVALANAGARIAVLGRHAQFVESPPSRRFVRHRPPPVSGTDRA